MKRKLLLGIFFFTLVVFNFVPHNVFAEGSIKVYDYESILVDINVNKDSTIDVSEKQTFNFDGNFHFAFREISLTRIAAITDISVIDDETGLPLKEIDYTPKDTTDPSVNGNFVVTNSGISQKVQWFYNLKDTTHTWTIKYKVHGAIEFDKDYDRLYWNLFTSYTVPVRHVEAHIEIPETVTLNNINIYGYRTNNLEFAKMFLSDGKTYVFKADDFSPNDAFTVDITWPKGVVDQSAAQRDFISQFYGIIVGFILSIVTIIILIIAWIYTNKVKINKSRIIAQYSPPEDLRPAIAEVVIKESLTPKGITATIIDMAVRGYLKIKEEKPRFNFSSVGGFLGGTFFLIGAFFFVNGFFLDMLNLTSMGGILFLIFLWLIVFIAIFKINWKKPDYIITQVKDTSDLLPYEKELIGNIFQGEEIFSTKEMSKSSSYAKARRMSRDIQLLTNKICNEANLETKAFNKAPTYSAIAVFVVLGVVTFCIAFFAFHFYKSQLSILILIIFINLEALLSYFVLDPKLTIHGIKLKEEWLGFKLYLEVAEKLRLQNLTPDLFQKYLPYAIIFGVEKKWAENFKNIQMDNPNWYVGYVRASSFNSSSVSSFSASGFSSSFVSSFNSAFSTSSGSAGGGSAGGGGGGGGGGAG